MVEMFGIYALLLAGWGIYSQRRAAARGDQAAADALLTAVPATPTLPLPALPVAALPVAALERGGAARRHLSTTL
jgi:hypothetical protein